MHNISVQYWLLADITDFILIYCLFPLFLCIYIKEKVALSWKNWFCTTLSVF